MVTIDYLYKVQIDCSTYEPQIDSSNTTITVTVKDFRNAIVTDANITVTVDKGYFTKYTRNSTDTNISGTSTKTYNGVTGSNGTFILTYHADDWGFVNILAGNNNVKLYVTGFRKVSLVQGTNYQKTNTSYTDDPFKEYKVLWYDDSIGIAKIKLKYYNKFKNGSTASTFSGSSAEAIAQLIFNSQPSTDPAVNPSLTTSSSSNLKGDLVPSVSIRRHWYRPDFVVYITSSGLIYFRTSTNNGEPANGAWVPLEWRYGTENIVSG